MANAKAAWVLSVATVLFICVANATAATDLQTTAPAPTQVPAPAPAPAPDIHQQERQVLRSNANRDLDRFQNAMAPPGAGDRRALWLDLGLVTAVVVLVGLWRRTVRHRALLSSVRAVAAADPPAVHDQQWRDACLAAGRGMPLGERADADNGPPLTSSDKV